MTVRSLIFLFCMALVLTDCRQAADSPQEAQARLTAVPQWVLNEMYVDDALRFENGKMLESFGNVNFDRYMESVQFREDGVFVGNFGGETDPMLLSWKVDPAGQTLVVGVADTTVTAGTWTIAPADVYTDSFEMKTRSTAYDYPRETRISLKFVRKD